MTLQKAVPMIRSRIFTSSHRFSTCRACFSTEAAAVKSTESPVTSTNQSSTASIKSSRSAKIAAFNVKPMPNHRSRLEGWHYNVNKPLSPRPVVQTPRVSTDGSPIEVHFLVKRTASLQLPVYLQRPGSAGTQAVTRIRSVEGDINELAREVQIMLGPGARVEPRVGKVNIKGNYVKPVKEWLTQLGF